MDYSIGQHVQLLILRMDALEASAIEARRAATTGAVHESAVAKPDAQTTPGDGLIERLRHMTDNHHAIKDSAAIEAAADALQSQQSEIASLRGALERIAASDLADMNTVHPESCARIAREALTVNTMG